MIERFSNEARFGGVLEQIEARLDWAEKRLQAEFPGYPKSTSAKAIHCAIEKIKRLSAKGTHRYSTAWPSTASTLNLELGPDGQLRTFLGAGLYLNHSTGEVDDVYRNPDLIYERKINWRGY